MRHASHNRRPDAAAKAFRRIAIKYSNEMAIVKAPGPCGGASIASSSILRRWFGTRGPNFPLSRLESRLMCPACGSRRVTVVFEPPTNRQVRSR